MGLLTALAGLLFLLGAAVLTKVAVAQGAPAFGDLVGAALGVLALAVLAIGLVEMIAAFGVWRGSAWGRVLGLLYGVLGVLLGLADLVGRSGANATASSGAGALIPLAVYGIISVALAFGWKTQP